jgi:hypothetical protein
MFYQSRFALMVDLAQPSEESGHLRNASKEEKLDINWRQKNKLPNNMV